jgi:UDPglucose--hexose-1-phosphate uridylyltransferase
MAELRGDLLSGRWVIIAENRAARPDELRPSTVRRIIVPCPFCRGREAETPPAVATYFSRTAPGAEQGWQVRVVPNKFPAVQFEEATPSTNDVLHPAQPALGAHEVVVESPDHVVSLAALTDEQVELTFAAYQDRLAFWQRDERLAYGLVFKNARAAGGASLEHAHSQLIATPIVPAEVAGEVAQANAFHRQHGRCAFCELLDRELADSRRIVATTEQFVAYCPYAARFPYETWIVPRQHAHRFEQVDAGQRRELAHLVRDLIRRLESLSPETAYNYWIHTAPWRTPSCDFYHWHVEVITRLTRIAGFELGTGFYINPVSPEEAASRLRAAADGV